MKKALLALLAFAPVFFFSCSKDEKDKPTPPEPEVVEVTTTTASAEKGNGTIEIPVSTNVNLSVTISDNAKDWLYYVETRAVRTATVVIGYRANPRAAAREGVVTIKGKDLSSSVTITQAAADPTVSVDIESRTVNPRGMTFSLTPESNDNITASTTADWLTAKGNADGVYNFEAALNGTGEAREAKVVFACQTNPNVKAEVTITQKPANTDPNAISILAIGNSFSVDAMEYLYPVLEELGYTKIRLGNLYVGGCSLETHLENLKDDAPAYVYYTNDNGTWTSTPDVPASQALEPDNWDYITLQQNSGNSGVASSYEPLDELIAEVREFCEYTPLVWNMTWAYAQNSTHADFANYSKDQLEMYGDIVATVEEKIKDNAEFEKIIPFGTAIQNLRTSFFEDFVTRDGYHLSYNIGRLIAAYTFAAAISGKSIDAVTTVPLNGEGQPAYKYEDDYLPAIKEAVKNAIAKPFEVTATTAYAPAKNLVPNNELRAIATDAGYNLANYTEVQFTIIHNAYYNSSANQNSTCGSASPSNIIAAFTGGTAANMANFATTKIFEKGQLPVGTVIVVKNGCSYRPDGWSALGTVNSSRPGNVSTTVVEVKDEWWGNLNYKAFNIQKGGVALDAVGQKELESAVSVFVPKTARGIDGEDYNPGNWNW